MIYNNVTLCLSQGNCTKLKRRPLRDSSSLIASRTAEMARDLRKLLHLMLYADSLSYIRSSGLSVGHDGVHYLSSCFRRVIVNSNKDNFGGGQQGVHRHAGAIAMIAIAHGDS